MIVLFICLQADVLNCEAKASKPTTWVLQSLDFPHPGLHGWYEVAQCPGWVIHGDTGDADRMSLSRLSEQNRIPQKVVVCLSLPPTANSQKPLSPLQFFMVHVKRPSWAKLLHGSSMSTHPQLWPPVS